MRMSSRVARDSGTPSSHWRFDSFAADDSSGAGTHDDAAELSAQPSGKTMARQALDEAYKRGLHDGFHAGRTQAAEELGAKRLAFEDLIASMQQQFATLDKDVGDALTKLAFGLAAQVTRHEVGQRPEMVASIVRDALSELSIRATHPALLLHPDDHRFITPQLGKDLKLRGCRIVADPGVTPGGCRIVSETSEVDATIESRWERALLNMGYAHSEGNDVTTTR
jgi:flagellar assembly protein FliH